MPWGGFLDAWVIYCQDGAVFGEGRLSTGKSVWGVKKREKAKQKLANYSIGLVLRTEKFRMKENEGGERGMVLVNGALGKRKMGEKKRIIIQRQAFQQAPYRS